MQPTLMLGTVQLGLPYGVANRTGQPDQDSATQIIEAAWEEGIRAFDTAQGYGISESVLGEAFRRLNIADQAMVVSKIDPNVDHGDESSVLRSVEGSLERLGVPRLEGLLLHDETKLDLWNSGLSEIAAKAVCQGVTSTFGVSVYTPARAMAAIACDGITIVQAPTSVMDRRFENVGLFREARRLAKSVHVRSVFLQGLLLIDPQELPATLAAEAGPVVARLDELASSLQIPRRDLALMVVRSTIGEQDRVVFGADTPDHVRENVRSWSRTPIPEVADAVEAAVGSVDERLLNPATWPSEWNLASTKASA